MTDIAELGIKVDSGDVRTSTRDLDRMGRTSQDTTRRVQSATTAIKSFIGALAIGGTIRAVIRNTVEQERVTAQLEATLRSTGRYTPELSRAMQGYASEIQQVTTFGDEAIISTQALLLTFTQIGGETFPRATRAIADMATAMGTDLKAATLQVGKALNDPIRGVSALAESGIQFTEVQKDMIREMVESGRVAEAQTVILSELETQFGGSARAARDTLGGAIQSLKNSFGDLLEGDSGGDGVRGATEAVNKLSAVLNDPQTKQSFDTLVSSVLSLATGLASATAEMVNFTRFIGEHFGRLVAGSDNPIGQLDQQIGDVQSRIAVLVEELNKPQLFRMNPLRGTDSIGQEIYEQRQQLERLTATRRDLVNLEMMAAPVDKQTAADRVQQLAAISTAHTENGDAARKASEEAAKAAQQLWDTNQRTVEGLQFQAETLGWTTEAVQLYRLETEGATAAQLADAEAALHRIGLYEQQQQAIEELQRAEEQAAARLGQFDAIAGQEQKHQQELEQLRMLNEMKLIEDARYLEIKGQLEREHAVAMMMLEEERFRQQSMGNELVMASLDQLGAAASNAFANILSGAGNSKEAVQQLGRAILQEGVNALIQMGIQYVKNLIIGQSAQAAATAGAVASGTAMAAAYAPAAALASLASFGANSIPASAGVVSTMATTKLAALASFDGGGFTGYGSRSGGMDGKGGFPAILHPNETVVDHTKGQGMGGTVVNINNAPPGTRTQSRQSADGKEVIDVILGDLRSDGPISRTMGQTFGVQRRGA